ncbi:MAG: TetR/AcrR family transcriptional regulator [Lacisediminihabitans sp.]
MSTTSQRAAKVGRPRAVSDTAPETSPRDQILTAAAALFVEQGFGATSTRAIAEAVGIRQASLYYHFAGKDEILAELLETSVRPSVEIARRLLDEAGDDPAAAAATLYELALIDVDTLAKTPHNIGTLYLLPEVQDVRYNAFHSERDQLQAVYGQLGMLARGSGAASDTAEAKAVVPDGALLGAALIQLVEVVIQLRRSGACPESISAPAIAASCLRLIGISEPAVARAVKKYSASSSEQGSPAD